MTWSPSQTDVARLLSSEKPTFAAKRLEHVTVADVRQVHRDSPLFHQSVETEVRHHRDRNLVDAERERQHRDDLVAVDDIALLIDREHAVTVTVERDTEIVTSGSHRLAKHSRDRLRRSRR